MCVAGVFVSCSSCEEKSKATDSYLDKPYTFIVGILTPDSLREYAQEIFVGRIIPDDNPPTAVFGNDEIVNLVIGTMRSWYFAEVRPYADAEVSVTDELGNRVAFDYIDNGYYRDSDRERQVYPEQRYYLEVKRGDDIFTSETKVPQQFTLTNVAPGDTVLPTLGPSGVYGFWLQWTKSLGSFFYRFYALTNEAGSARLGHTFSENDYGQPFFFKDTTLGGVARIDLQALAVDTNYARIYRPGNLFAGSNEWMEWFESQNELPLPERSNITGKNVTGVFGSFAQVKLTFYGRKPD
jgi:hypothetical protein